MLEEIKKVEEALKQKLEKAGLLITEVHLDIKQGEFVICDVKFAIRDKDGKMQFKEILQDNGIWSKETYTNIDMIFFIKPGTDFLKDNFEPFIFPNPYNAGKIRKTPEPFEKMKIHLPPTMLGQSIFGY